MFHYSSVQTHQLMTPTGKKVKQTEVKVKGNQGIKKVSIMDEKGIHSDVIPLKKNEMKNVLMLVVVILSINISIKYFY